MQTRPSFGHAAIVLFIVALWGTPRLDTSISLSSGVALAIYAGFLVVAFGWSRKALKGNTGWSLASALSEECNFIESKPDAAGVVPNLANIQNFLLAGTALFAPYVANQIKAAIK